MLCENDLREGGEEKLLGEISGKRGRKSLEWTNGERKKLRRTRLNGANNYKWSLGSRWFQSCGIQLMEPYDKRDLAHLVMFLPGLPRRSENWPPQRMFKKGWTLDFLYWQCKTSESYDSVLFWLQIKMYANVILGEN